MARIQERFIKDACEGKDRLVLQVIYLINKDKLAIAANFTTQKTIVNLKTVLVKDLSKLIEC